MIKYTAEEIEARMIYLGMAIPDFHIVGIRSQESIPDKFDDYIYIIKNHQIINGPYTCTTNPGQYYLQNLLNPKGAALLVANKQYWNCFKKGLHKGNPALIQCGELLVYRDNDLDIHAEEIGEPMKAGPECRIDIHGTYKSWVSLLIGKFSAGCQVLNNPEDFKAFLASCEASAKGLFTYTLLKEW